MRFVLLSIIILLFTEQLPAQSSKYQFAHITIKDGLSQNRVNGIYKDWRGFMWFGTVSGLNRYDGNDFKIFRHELRDSTSISDNYITSISAGPDHKLWINTQNGFNVYDPVTETFNRHPLALLKQYGVPDDHIRDVYKDQQDNCWFIHNRRGLYYYNAKDKKTVHLLHRAGYPQSISSDNIDAIKEDQQGNYWIIDSNGVLEKLNGSNLKVIYRTDSLSIMNRREAGDYHLYIDHAGDLWIYRSDHPGGLFYFNSQKQVFRHLIAGAGGLNSNIVFGVEQDNNGKIWVGTDHGGINLINKKDFSITYIENDPDDGKSLSQNAVISLYKDNAGTIWIGTYKKGINYYNSKLLQFPVYQHESSDPNSLPYDDVNRFAEDDKGNLWIGTNGGGLIYYNRRNNTYQQYQHNPNDPNSISNDVIVSLCIDHNQKLWIGTYYGGMDYYNGKKFIHYRHNDSDSNSLADDRVWDIYEDQSDRLWIGTLGGGLDLFDRADNTFHHYGTGTSPNLHSDYISSLTSDRQGRLWISTANGIDVLNTDNEKIIHYEHQPEDISSLINNNVILCMQDSRGWMWIGTRDGLDLLIPGKKTFKVFIQEEGLPDNTILTMLEDDDHNLWIGTPKGLSNLIITKDQQENKYIFHFKNYDELNGLQGREFNGKAAYKLRNGKLVFGGPNGFNVFNPNNITINHKAPPVVLTDFQVFNKEVGIGKKIKGKVILPQAISATKTIKLEYGENIFSIEFAALNYLHPQKNKYTYKLEGFNDDWLTTDENARKATYTNLDPGEYTFRVRASNNDGVWNNVGASLRIIILPPFWRTPLAFIIYAILIIGILILARHLILERAKLNFRMEQQRQETQQMIELDMMKTRFFTNVSHEFRTPLTLIITPLEKIINHTKDPKLKEQFQLMARNAKRLLSLVNQLLDFRKMEVQEIKLNLSEGDIIKFLKDIAYSFSDLSEKKDIHFSFESNLDLLETVFDPDKLERVLFNLLSNAFKFTPEHGKVEVKINYRQKEGGGEDELEVKVKDNGIGIPQEKHEKIFDRFFQHEVPGTIINQGSGIGLSITREFVKLHGGNIHVESEPEKGSTFIIMLPLRRIKPLAEQTTGEAAKINQPEKTNEESYDQFALQNRKNKKPMVMIIEDNEDFRFYLKDNLKQYYLIADFPNGVDGWRFIPQIQPDLIVSDIMMPGIDGIRLCHKIKHDKRTAHIPVILLTARSAEEQQLEGYGSGVDEYIVKPFNFEILLSRIKNLIRQRKIVLQAMQPPLEVNPSAINIDSEEAKFVQRALALVEENISDPEFSVKDMSRQLFMSRVSLYKKLNTITGKTPIEFIRDIRLKRAAQLLEKSKLTIAEVAYQVGFNNPKYFSKYFKEAFGVLPSVYAQERRGNGGNKS